MKDRISEMGGRRGSSVGPDGAPAGRVTLRVVGLDRMNTYQHGSGRQTVNVNYGAIKSTAPTVVAAKQTLLATNRLGKTISTVGKEIVDINKEGFSTKDIIIWSKRRDEGKVNTADCRMAADCLRRLGFEQKQGRFDDDSYRKWFKK